MPIEEELKSLNTDELKTLRGGLRGEQVDMEQFKSTANKLSTGTLKQLRQDIDQSMSEQEKKKFLKDMFEAQTLTGQLKQAGRSALESAVEVGEFIDKYTGAPSRAAFEAFQKGEPFQAPGRFVEQFGEDPSLAPTGKELATRAGLSTQEDINLPLIGDVSPAGIGGLALDIALDPTNIIPIGAGAKLLGKGGKASLNLAKRGIAKGSATATRLLRKKSRLADEVIEALSLKFKPQRAVDFEEMVNIAQKNGIDPEILPEAIEFGKESVITRAMRKKGEGVLGEPILRRHENAVKQVNQSIVNKLEDISGGSILAPEEAGSVIREGFKDSIEQFFKDIDFTYKSIGDQVGPEFRLDPTSMKKLNSVYKKWGPRIEKAKRSIDPGKRKQADVIQDALNKIQQADGNYAELIDDLQDIGTAGYNRATIVGEPPIDIKSLRELYSDVQKPIMETIGRQLGPDIADDLLVNNMAISDFLSDRNVLARTVLNDRLADETVFKVLVENADTKKIESLLNILPEDQINRLKGSFFDGLIKRDIEGQFTFRSVFNRLQNKEKVAKRLFEPEELNDLIDLTRLGDRLGLPIMSTSGTGAAESFRNIPEAVSRGLTNDVILDSLKRMARGEKAVPTQASKAGISFSRGPLEKGIKGTQVLSVQERNQ